MLDIRTFENEPSLWLSDIMNSVANMFGYQKNELVGKLDSSWKDFINNMNHGEIGDNYRFGIKNGTVILEVVVAGHNPDDIKVKYQNESKTLKIVDEVKVENAPWYHKTLDLTFTLPETVIRDSFKKEIQNGVLTFTANYEPDDDTKAMPVGDGFENI